MSSKPNIFNILKQINEKTTEYEYDKKIVSGYQLMNWLSHDQFLIDYVQEINKVIFISGMKDKTIYDYFFHVIPKRRRYIKWIKKEPKDKERIKEIEKISEINNVSMMEAEYIHDIVNRINNNGDDIPF